MSAWRAGRIAAASVVLALGVARAQSVEMPRVPQRLALAEEPNVAGMHYSPHDRPVRWLSDGRIIVWHIEAYHLYDVGGRVCGGTGLYAVPSDGKSSATALIVGKPVCDAESFAVDARASRAIFSARVPVNSATLFRLDMRTGSADSVRVRCVAWLEGPHFGPGDSLIAANGMCGSYEGEYEIYLLRSDGSRFHRLGGVDRASRYDPSWSPDGRRIAFERRYGEIPNDTSEIAVSDITDAGFRRLAGGSDPSWSPDGQWIAFLGGAGPRGRDYVLSLIRPDGSDERVVFKNTIRTTFSLGWGPIREGGISGPLVWSPDGRQLAFVRYFDAGGSLWILDIASGSVRRLTRAGK
jgi:Tol biopolymer transport system component